MSDAVADVYAASREYLEREGWWKGNVLGPNGQQVCLLGAIIYSQGYTEERDLDERPLLKTAVQNLAKMIDPSWGTTLDPYHLSAPTFVATWNDEGERVKQQVLDLLAKAEKIERAGFDPDA